MKVPKEIRIHAATKGKWIFPFSEFHDPEKPVLSLAGDQRRCVTEFNQKVVNGAINFETIPCLCGCADFNLLASYDRYGLDQSTVACVNCGLIQSNPRMTREAYAEFYSSDTYRRCYDSSDYLNIYEEKYSLDTGKHILDEIMKLKRVGAGVSVLEIGAGGGWNLLPFQKAGAEILGYDYSPTLVDLGDKHGVPMKQGSVDDIQGKFDIIFLNHVWEHLLDPVSALTRILRHLKSDGIIYIAIPNIFNGMLFQFQNAHTYYFDPRTFHYYASKAGLNLISFGTAERSHMFGIFKPGEDLNVRNLKGHYKDVLWKLRIVRIKRSIKVYIRSLGLMK